jgi:hypothetical protein
MVFRQNTAYINCRVNRFYGNKNGLHTPIIGTIRSAFPARRAVAARPKSSTGVASHLPNIGKKWRLFEQAAR